MTRSDANAGGLIGLRGLRRVWRTTTFRLTVAFAALFALGIVLLLGLVYARTAGYLTYRVDHIIAAERDALQASGPEGVLPLLRSAAARDPLTAFGLYASDGERVGGAAWLTPSDLPLDGQPHEVARRGRRPPQRALAVRLPWGEILVIQRDTNQLVELRRIILDALLWSGALISVSGLALAVLLGLLPLQRVRAIQAATEAIGEGDMRMRLPIGGGGDELDEMAGVVNGMMDEVERLMTQARSVGEGVAHELRTPLTRLRASLEHALQAHEPGDPVRPLLETCLAEADSVLARFRALLRIAAVEARSRRGGIGRVSLGAIVEQVADLYEPLAAEQGIAMVVEVGGVAELRADAELMFEALSNLVDNALKFTPAGGTVGLSLTETFAGVEIVVRDTGPGIPPAERALVTQRFYRGKGAAGAPGHGLGLSLVAAVADLHGFRMSIEDAAPGAVVRLNCGVA